MRLKLRHRELDLSRPRVMGVLNVTPDSFSDGGRHLEPAAAVARALAMVEDGAAIIDIGGESTRPGAEPVPEAEERRRVLPVIEALRRETDIPISIDTMKAGVMRDAVAAGADLINDVNALRGDGALRAAVDSGAAVCLMHMDREPRTMQLDPRYRDVVGEVRDFLAARVAAFEAAGGDRRRLCLDPGFGFGKTLAHNLQLLAGLPALAGAGLPLLVGLSRKSMFGALLGRELGERLPASLAAAVVAVMSGAHIVRCHDVRETMDAITVASEVRRAQSSNTPT